MEKTRKKIIQGYLRFRKKYAMGNNSVMKRLSHDGQQPNIMVIACCDSRVDPALILQCAPGDLFTVRNVANIVPPYVLDKEHHGTSAALEFGVCYLNIKHLIILGHSQCGGIEALIKNKMLIQNDFIGAWVSLIGAPTSTDINILAKQSLLNSYQNCLTFPWIKSRVENNTLTISRWFFDIEAGEILEYSPDNNAYIPLH